MPICTSINCNAINPGLWERWILIFESIVDYYSLATDENVLRDQIDNGFCPPESYLSDEALTSLYDESFRSSELLAINPNEGERHCILQGLQSVISRYLSLKSKINEIGLPEDVLKYYESFCDECDITENILKWHEIASKGIGLNNAIEKTNAYSLYEVMNGKCIENIPFEHFEGIINNGYYQKLEYERIPDSDEYYICDAGPEIRWKPKQEHLFSFWICTLILKELHSERDFIIYNNTDLQIKRNLPDWVDDCFSFPNEDHFKNLPSHKLKEEDVEIVSQFLGRPMFKDLCSNEGIRSLLNYESPYETLSMRRSITNYIEGCTDKTKRLEILLRTINEESLYWEDNIDAFVGEFNDQNYHNRKLRERETAYQSRKELSDCFHLIFLGKKTKFDDALSMGETNIGKLLSQYEYAHTKEMSLKYGLPLLSKDDIYQMIGRCVKSNYCISSALSGLLAELTTRQTDSIDLSDSYAKNVIKLALQEKYIENNGTSVTIVKGCMTQLANFLVSQELVCPSNWVQAMEAYKNTKQLTPRDRMEIAQYLNFRKVDMLFGVSYQKISKAFKNENKDFANIIDMLWQKHKPDVLSKY